MADFSKNTYSLHALLGFFVFRVRDILHVCQNTSKSDANVVDG